MKAILVIDLNDTTLKEWNTDISKCWARVIVYAPIKGTAHGIGSCVYANESVELKPLPKEHGRLGDLDALEKEMINGIKAGNLEEGYEEYSNINNIDDCVECVRFADTIIEADKGEE